MRDRTGEVWELEGGRLLTLVLAPAKRLERDDGPYREFAVHEALDLLSGRLFPLYERDSDPLETWPETATRRIA